MLHFSAEQLHRAAGAVLRGIGAPEDIAEYLAGSLIENNLVGHDSHGIIRIPIYTQRVEEGRVKPTARPAILRETLTTAVVTANWGFGQVGVKFATELAIKKAKESNLAAVNVVECNHMGRLGEFSSLIAAQGMIGIVITGGFSAQFRSVAPYGGAGRALGTNPYSFAVPVGADRSPFLSDFATSIIAWGKVMVARDKGESVPDGAVIDSQGLPSTDPNAYFDGGMLLPFGGHKGYALSLFADLMGSLLGGSEELGDPPHTQGTFILALRVDAFRPFSEFTAAVDKRFAEIKAVSPAPGFTEVLIPGEPETRTKAQRLNEGIPIPEDTWEKIVATAKKYKVEVEEYIRG